MANALLAEVDKVVSWMQSGYQLRAWMGGSAFLQSNISAQIEHVSHGAMTLLRKRRLLKVKDKFSAHGDLCFVYELRDRKAKGPTQDTESQTVKQ